MSQNNEQPGGPGTTDNAASRQGIADRVRAWFAENWNEETNTGKAKLAGLAVLVFMFVLTLMGDNGERDGGASQRHAQAQSESPEPAPAGESLEDAELQAREIYQAYENRVAQLAGEKDEVAGKLQDSQSESAQQAAELDAGADQASATYDEYEARIAMLESEKQALEQQLHDKASELDAARRELARLREKIDGMQQDDPPPSAADAIRREMHQQLESLRSLLDELLEDIEPESPAPAEPRPL